MVPVALGCPLLAAAQVPKQGVLLSGVGHDDLARHESTEAALKFFVRSRSFAQNLLRASRSQTWPAPDTETPAR